MPKDNIDYSNTIIYKICCKDINITDLYVGHTTNFVKRKCTHKRSCNASASTNPKLKIYKTIIENGGWDNWDMIEIAKYNCANVTEAKTKEQQHYEELQCKLITSQKHLNKHKDSKKTYSCDICDKAYETSSGLWKHKRICNETKSGLTEKELIFMLIKENSEMKNMMMEVIKNGTHNNTNNTNNINNTTNNNQNTFNLQFFLNEQCKNAINMSDFIDSIQLQIEDLEETGYLGYVEGISKVVIKNLNALNVHDRPIHCSDSKREVIYIKDNEQWTKDNENKDKMKSMIKHVAHKNIKQIPEWVKKYPDCLDSDSNQNDKYLQIVSNAMSGSTEDEQRTNINKIVSKIAKEVIITK